MNQDQYQEDKLIDDFFYIEDKGGISKINDKQDLTLKLNALKVEMTIQKLLEEEKSGVYNLTTKINSILEK